MSSSGSSSLIEGVPVTKGRRVEVESEGEWWDAEILKIKHGQFKIHYVGGLDDEDEWIEIGSERLRLPRDQKQDRAALDDAPKKRGRLAQQEAVDPVPVPTNLPFKKSTIKDTSKKRQWKALKKVLEAEVADKLPLDVPTYSGIEAPPSLLPPKKYCDLTGLPAKYTDPKTRLRYFSAQEYVQVRYLSEHTVEEFLKFRNATVALK